MGERDKALEMLRKGRALVAPLAERSGHALWKQYLKAFDADIAALDGEAGGGIPPLTEGIKGNFQTFRYFLK